MVVDGIAFSPPTGLEDRSNYVHRAEGPREELAVELELPAGSATPASEVIAEQREAMEGFLDAAFGVEAEGDTRLAGAPARFMRYWFDDAGERRYGETVVGNPGAGDYVRVSYKGEVERGVVAATVDPVIASFRPATEEREAAAGTRTRQAGAWAYELPERFSDPRARIWSDGDELQILLQVPASGSAPLELESLIVRSLEPGRTQLARDDRELDQVSLGGTLAHLHQRGSLDLEWAAYVALVRLDPPPEVGGATREVAIVATAPWSADAALGQLVETLLASVALAQSEARP